MAGNLLNEIEKIASLAAEIEISEKDLDIITCVKEAREEEKQLELMYSEMNRTYFKLIEKLYVTSKHSEYHYQLEPFQK